MNSVEFNPQTEVDIRKVKELMIGKE
jgi:hypothetical protein